MKKIFSIIFVACSMTIVTSCGNSKTNDEAETSSADIAEVAEVAEVAPDPEPEIQSPAVTPPVTIKAVQYGTWMGGKSRTFITLTLKSNGLVEGNMSDQEWQRKGEEDWFVAGGDKDNIPAIYQGHQISGKWTSRHREVGEEYQKVYDTPAGFIPDDGDYLFRSWERCSEFTPNESDFKIIEITKG